MVIPIHQAGYHLPKPDAQEMWRVNCLELGSRDRLVPSEHSYYTATGISVAEHTLTALPRSVL